MPRSHTQVQTYLKHAPFVKIQIPMPIKSFKDSENSFLSSLSQLFIINNNIIIIINPTDPVSSNCGLEEPEHLDIMALVPTLSHSFLHSNQHKLPWPILGLQILFDEEEASWGRVSRQTGGHRRYLLRYKGGGRSVQD